jgi:hypothetical protein
MRMQQSIVAQSGQASFCADCGAAALFVEDVDDR